MNDELRDMLTDGEEPLWEGKPKKLCFVLRNFGRHLPAAIIFGVFDALSISIVVKNGAFSRMWPVLVVFFALHLLPVWKCIGKLISSNLEYKNVIYVMTNRRIILRSGIVGLDFDGVDYSDISNIWVDVSPMGKMLGVGTLVIATTSGRLSRFYAISEPYDAYRKVNKLLIDMRADIHFPNAYRPENSPRYHAKYEG